MYMHDGNIPLTDIATRFVLWSFLFTVTPIMPKHQQLATLVLFDADIMIKSCPSSTTCQNYILVAI